MFFGLTQIPAQSRDRNAVPRHSGENGAIAGFLVWFCRVTGLEAASLMMARPTPVPVRTQSRPQTDPYRISPLGM
jgi:hypothetical protein